MSENDTVVVRKLSDGTMVQVLSDGSTIPYVDSPGTDWARVLAMTEEEIEANALSDPDNPPITPEELARMRVFPHPKRIREKLKLTQEEFSERFEIPLGTLRDWEQGASYPDRAARTLLRVIEQDPEGVVKALEKSYLLPIPSSPNSR
jgi:putative transcriptional regulator